ncbi:hypothetical protein G6F37_008526 [Rhizopus arrhizus]|nr:hypothetical protein G6F38_008696 [Rhizopus arrhizus]KAG1155454.1 hypothetical protein G6F37_008526 [Rhizopus arrhizus]
MARAQMEYDLAVSVLNLNHLIKLKSCQNECIRRVFVAPIEIAPFGNVVSLSWIVLMIESSRNYSINFCKITLQLSACRLLLTQGPILWLPMTRCERSRVLR